ncbi:MAG: sn-glycerol-1-phosphate dehydrogenase [Spirochaetaceae bacterium]
MGSYPETTVVSEGAAAALVPWLRERGYSMVLLLSDTQTHAAHAAEVERLLTTSGCGAKAAVLEGAHVLADEVHVVEAFVSLTPEIDVVCSVGSGTITDIGRFLAHRGLRPFVSLPTAASVDGFYSIGAPLILKGVKRTVICRPPVALFADTEVLSRAPARLTAAGFGDLLGKLTSWADWNLGALLWDEPFDQQISNSLYSVSRNTLEVAADDFGGLMRLLIESGACMVDAGESRPASGAEHHLSHFWEMSFLSQGEVPPLHGAMVGYATQIAAALYHHLLSVDPGTQPLEVADDEARIREGYPEEVAAQLVRDQKPFLSLTDAARRELRRRIADRWNSVLEIAGKVPAPAEVRRSLGTAGAPRRAEELGLAEDAVSRALKYAHYLRNRFTVLKLYRFLGIDPEPVARQALGGF